MKSLGFIVQGVALVVVGFFVGHGHPLFGLIVGSICIGGGVVCSILSIMENEYGNPR